MWTFFYGIAKETAQQTASFLQASAGSQRPAKKKYTQLKDRVARAIDNYGRSDRLTFLRAMAQISWSETVMLLLRVLSCQLTEKARLNERVLKRHVLKKFMLKRPRDELTCDEPTCDEPTCDETLGNRYRVLVDRYSRLQS